MSGIGELLAGGAVGTLCSELYKGIVKPIGKFRKLKPQLENIWSTLHSLQPLIVQIEGQNKKLKFPDEELQNIRNELCKGLNLIHECLENPEWYKIPKYHDQLLEFDRSLKRQLDLIPMQSLRDGKTSLLMQIEQADKLDELIGYEKENLELTRQIERILPKPKTETSKASPVPVGLGVPLKELKKLLEDGVSSLVLTGPQGYGKTTLAKQFCQDEDVKDIFKNNIFFVLVSKKPNLEHIVQQLYRHKEYQVPNDLHLEEIDVLRLQKFLKEPRQNPVLLVLDDVWSESILDKFDQFKMSNYKILVTSISEFPRFGYAYRLKPLNDEDAIRDGNFPRG